ncbi:cell surface protein [Pediococcus siamensis]|uniref:cell surface protein n=1 Tax=Pediococcus siamensis TaxID=381829 RepID=UPI0039A2FD81
MKRILKSLIVFITLTSLLGFYHYQKTYADDAESLISLSTQTPTANVGDVVAVKVTRSQIQVADTQEVSLVVPVGLEIEQTKLAQTAQTSHFQYRLESDHLVLTMSKTTAGSFALPFVVNSAGTYSLSCIDSGGALKSNVLQISGQSASETSATQATSESQSSTAQSASSEEQASSASIDNQAQTTAESTKSDSSTNEKESSNAQSASAQANTASDFSVSSSTANSSSKTPTKSGRAGATADYTLDQIPGKHGIAYLYYYANTSAQAISGIVQDTVKEKITASYTLTKLSGSGPNPPQAGVSQSLGTIQATGSGAKDKFSFSIPSNKFPTYTAAIVGSVYQLRVFFTNAQGFVSSFTLRIGYISGDLTLTAPDKIDFGSNLDPNLTGKQVYMGKIAAGSQALSVKDTRVLPSGVTDNGWSLTVALTKQMTGTTTKSVLTNSLHYLNAGTDYTLSSAASPVKNLTTSEPNTTTDISGDWNNQNGLAFEPTAGQPIAGETYSGTVTWNLQDTPANQ